MKFHPVISIFLGVIVSFILYLIALSVFGVIGWIGAFIIIPGSSWFGTLLLTISYILGGFIATYLAKEKKIQYGVYTGVIILTIGIIQTSINNFPVVIHISKFIVYIISAAIGGYLAVLLAKHLKTKHITKNSS